MTLLAIVNPTSLLGKELREGLERLPQRWTDLRLLATDSDQVGTLTSVGGRAAVVQALEDGGLRGVDLTFVCDGGGVERAQGPLAASSGTIVLAPADRAITAAPLVAGVNLERGAVAALAASPHPGVIALAHLLHPLAPLGPFTAAAVLILPASIRDQAGIDELFEQTRSILAFQGQQPQEVFGRQLAFNLLPSPLPSAAVADLSRVLAEGGGGPPGAICVQALQGGFFHGIAVSAVVSFEPDPGIDRVREALAGHAFLEAFEEPDLLGPIDAAAHEHILLGAVAAAAEHPGSYWLWGTMDNLTRGGATNALAIAAAMLGW